MLKIVHHGSRVDNMKPEVENKVDEIKRQFSRWLEYYINEETTDIECDFVMHLTIFGKTGNEKITLKS